MRCRCASSAMPPPYFVSGLLGRLLRSGLFGSGLRFLRRSGHFLGGRLLRGNLLRRLVAMIVPAAGAVDMALLALDRGFPLRPPRRGLADLRGAEQVIDDFVLEERRAQLRLRHRLATDIFEELLPVLGAVLLG